MLGDLYVPAERGGYAGVVSFRYVFLFPFFFLFFFCPFPFVSLHLLVLLLLLTTTTMALVLVTYGVGYSTYYSCLQASLSTLFLEKYDISGRASGLVYMPFGVACALSAMATGKLLDHNYQKTAAAEPSPSSFSFFFPSIFTARPLPLPRRARPPPHNNLVRPPQRHPHRRLRTGWHLEYLPARPRSSSSSMPGVLVAQFLIGLTLQPMFTALNTLLVDRHQDCPSTAQAACNLVRCEMAAAYLAALDALLRALGPGWTFVLFAAGLFAAVGLLVVLERKGLGWRQARARRLAENP